MASKEPKPKREKVEELEINDLETLKILTDPTRLAILESLHEPRSVTEVADLLEVPRTRLYHHINLLEDHGLIRVASTRQKGALSEKLYEPAAASYVPGPDLMESTNPVERVDAAIAGIIDTTREDMRRSLLEHWTGESESKEISMFRSLARVTADEAEQFTEEFTKLFAKYSKLHKEDDPSDNTHMYALTFLFYPSSRDRR